MQNANNNNRLTADNHCRWAGAKSKYSTESIIFLFVLEMSVCFYYYVAYTWALSPLLIMDEWMIH